MPPDAICFVVPRNLGHFFAFLFLSWRSSISLRRDFSGTETFGWRWISYLGSVRNKVCESSRLGNVRRYESPANFLPLKLNAKCEDSFEFQLKLKSPFLLHRKCKAQERFWRSTAKKLLRVGKNELPKAFLTSLHTLPNCWFCCTAGFWQFCWSGSSARNRVENASEFYRAQKKAIQFNKWRQGGQFIVLLLQ